MRVTNQEMRRMLEDAVLQSQRDVYAIQEKMSSGRAVNRASDDPNTFGAISSLKDELATVERFSDNVTRARNELQVIDGALQDVVGILQRASEMAVQASDDTLDDASKAAYGETVEGLIVTLINLANTTHNGQSVFDGLRGGTEAFEGVDTDLDGRIDTVNYLGSTGQRKVEIAKGVYVSVNLAGSDAASQESAFVSSTADLFDTLIEFRDRLLAGDSIGASDSLERLDDCQEHVLGVLGSVGGRGSSLEFAQDALTIQERDLVNNIGDKESIDVAEAVMQLTTKQQAYQAALRATTAMMQEGLVDLLK